MDILEKFMQTNNLKDSDDLDALLECASLVRELTGKKQYDDICRIIVYTIEKGYYEAFSWTAAILQEEFEKENCALENFCCDLGKKISCYDEFVETLQVDFSSISNEIEKVYDENGEVCAFFNVMVYRTAFENIFLVSSENFDNRDNDYIQYRLSFAKNRSEQI